MGDMGLCGFHVTGAFLTALALIVAGVALLSYTILCYCSYKVVVKIRNHLKMMSQSLVQSQIINESRDIIVVILLISIIPLLGQVPAVVVKILQMFLPPFNPWLVRPTEAMFPLTSALNS